MTRQRGTSMQPGGMRYPTGMRDAWWITDLNDLVPSKTLERTADPKVPSPTFLQRIVKAATAMGARREETSALQCRHRDSRDCEGKLVVRLLDIPPEIQWRCDACDERGVLTNWHQSPWDLTDRRCRAESARALFWVTGTDFQTLLEIFPVDSYCERVIYSARPRGRRIAVQGRSSDFERLARTMSEEIHHEKNPHRSRALRRLRNRIDSLLAQLPSSNNACPRARDGEAEDLPGLLPPELIEHLKSSLAAPEIESYDDLSAHLNQVVDQINNAAEIQCAGLTPHQVNQLLQCDWESDRGAVVFNRDLRPCEVEPVPILSTVRMLLSEAVARGGLRSTTTGSLSRGLVHEFLQQVPMTERWLSELESIRQLNERRCFPLHLARCCASLAKLIERRGAKLHATQMGRRLLSPEGGGELMAQLFIACFRLFDLSSLDRSSKNDALQATVAFTLHAIGRTATVWRTPFELSMTALLPVARAEIPWDTTEDHQQLQMRTRLLDPLEQFGLLESKGHPGNRHLRGTQWFRKTGLYDRFVRFRV